MAVEGKKATECVWFSTKREKKRSIGLDIDMKISIGSCESHGAQREKLKRVVCLRVCWGEIRYGSGFHVASDGSVCRRGPLAVTEFINASVGSS
jgi:hypothetical protein